MVVPVSCAATTLSTWIWPVSGSTSTSTACVPNEKQGMFLAKAVGMV